MISGSNNDLAQRGAAGQTVASNIWWILLIIALLSVCFIVAMVYVARKRKGLEAEEQTSKVVAEAISQKDLDEDNGDNAEDGDGGDVVSAVGGTGGGEKEAVPESNETEHLKSEDPEEEIPAEELPKEEIPGQELAEEPPTNDSAEIELNIREDSTEKEHSQEHSKEPSNSQNHLEVMTHHPGKDINDTQSITGLSVASNGNQVVVPFEE